MNEGTQQKAGERIFDLASIENGGGLLDRIAENPPQPEPVLVEHRKRTAGADPAGGAASEAGKHDATDSAIEADESKVLRVDPKDYAHIKDHKGNAFDPAKHRVDAHGKPIFNARGRVKMLDQKNGEKNPVRLIFDSLASLLPNESEEERPQDECEAQAAVIVNDESTRMNAECIADLYAGTGFILAGKRFMKGWEKGRRSRLTTSLVNFDRQTGQLMKVAPLFILAHAFTTDMAMVTGGEMFDSGGGLFGWWKRVRANRRNQASQVHSAPDQEGGKDAA